MFQRVFGAKKPVTPAPTLAETSERMGKRDETLEARITKCDAELAQIRDQLAKVPKGSPAAQRLREKAMFALRQRKMLDGQRSQLASQRLTVDQLAFTHEAMKDSVEQVAALKDASKTMAKQLKATPVADVERLQDTLEDLYADAQEIQEALGRSYAVPDVTEGDLDAELAALGDPAAVGDAGLLDQLLAPTPGGPVAHPARPAPAMGTTDPDRLEQQLGLGQ